MTNVFLSQEAYTRLKAAKHEKESFSDVVLREVKQTVDLYKYFGCCAGIDVEKLNAEIKKERNREFK